MAGQYKKHQVANFTTTMLSAGIASLPVFSIKIEKQPCESRMN
jgi:hypothetical protein